MRSSSSPRRLSLPRRLLAILTALLLFLSLLAAAGLSLARTVFSEGNFRRMTASPAFSETLSSLLLPEDSAAAFSEIENSLSALTAEGGPLENFPLAAVERFAKLLSEDLLVETTNELRKYLIEGDDKAGITPDLLADFIKRREPDAQALWKEFGGDGDWSVDKEALRDSLQTVLGEGLPFSALLPEQEIPALSLLQSLLANRTLLLLWGAVGLLLLLLLLLCLPKPSALPFFYGLPLLLAGLLFLLGRALLPSLLRGAGGAGELLETLLLPPFLAFGGGLAAAGGVLLLAGLLSAVFRRSKRAARAASE